MTGAQTDDVADLRGKVALVTGASKGIGLAIVRAFVRHGAKVMLSSRKLDALEAASSTIDGVTAVFAANAGDPAGAEACICETIETFGRLDILVNNAATNPHYGPMIEANLALFDKVVQVNLRGPLAWTQLAWRYAMSEHGGSVINISSAGALMYGGPIGIYDITKAAMFYMTKHLANELGPGVRVNGIAPGLVQTDFARALWEPEGASAERPWPMRRLGQPQDVSNAALFLASDMSSWMTGEILVVDGGAVVA
jgi:NAD(P)-dependent dehydrogenase (short-subunit alcohol dehydrogenase family)